MKRIWSLALLLPLLVACTGEDDDAPGSSPESSATAFDDAACSAVISAQVPKELGWKKGKAQARATDASTCSWQLPAGVLRLRVLPVKGSGEEAARTVYDEECAGRASVTWLGDDPACVAQGKGKDPATLVILTDEHHVLEASVTPEKKVDRVDAGSALTLMASAAGRTL